MKKLSTLVLITLFSLNSFGQNQLDQENKKDSVTERNVIGFSPSKAKKVNGLKIRWWSDENHALKTNGVELGINPIGFFIPFLEVIHMPYIIKDNPEYPINYTKTKYDTINGLRIGVSFLDPAQINGLFLSVGGSYETKVSGLSITGTFNRHQEVKGVSIAGLANLDSEVTGVQISLLNKCAKLRGIQIGFWNTNEKRSLPFINWNLKK